ncbi:MAG: D-alanyl-D-alanine carboxypeptidase [Microbacterium sp.]|uniref:D-alanyl-D-alanine carboxypeptidase family protein n=1 Tax=Microbacterium sp. TaxID=51671 RepID=UPI0039E3D2B6
MTLDDAPPAQPTRRSRRIAAAGQTAHAPALGWLDPNDVLARTQAPTGIDLERENEPAPDLLAEARETRAVRPATVIPIALVLLVVLGYVVTTQLWPLNAIPPQIAAVQVQPSAAPAAELAWPKNGSAAVGVEGIGDPVASSEDPAPIASITKLVTTLMVLEELPLAVGEQGPKYAFTAQDQATYYSYEAGGQSALDVPVGRTLTQYQMLEGILLGSANNYVDRLAGELWPTDDVFVSAAQGWLDEHGLDGITVVNPSGFSMGNTATPDALIELAEEALANPVIAEIVAKKSVKLPGAGKVTNTNPLLSDRGVVGIKTGALPVYDTYALLSAKDVKVGDTKVRLHVAVLDQKSAKARASASRKLYRQLQKEVQPTPLVTAGTRAGLVTTAWGERVEAVTTSDAQVVLWNSATATATIDVGLSRDAKKGSPVGTLTLTGPLNTHTVDLTLADDIEGPSPWWRLTHPIELFGLGK